MMTEIQYRKIASNIQGLRRRNSKALQQLFFQAVFLAVGVSLSLQSSALWVLGQLVLGIFFWRSFVILHSCGHRSFSTSNVIDDIIGYMHSVFCFIPYESWKDIHNDHHKWTGWIDRDPTTVALSENPSKARLFIADLAWRLWIPVISLHYIASNFYNSSSPSYRNQKKIYGSITFIVFFHMLLILVLGMTYLKIFGISTLIYLNLGDLSLLTQHVHLPLEHSGNASVMPKKPFEQDHYSHTLVLPKFVTRWIVLGFNHHAFHHLFPALPFYYFEKAEEFKGENTQDWRWILKAKKMKVSDLIYAASKSS